jgi:hypothetical protein
MTHYTNSKGQQKLIADMLYPHLLNAHDKLVRERKDDSRDGEIRTMAARIAELETEFSKEGDAV